MPSPDYLSDRFPVLGEHLARTLLATLPTPVCEHSISVGGKTRKLSVKYDNLTGSLYGGNKVRKLEYIFSQAAHKERTRIATFGAVGSNHALATALYARAAGFDCTCFLSHQVNTPLVATTLSAHMRNGTELLRFGGTYSTRLRTLRDALWGKRAWVIPMGGSSWRGTIGFVAAGLELAEQISRDEIPAPDRIYVGTGTMGTAVGIAIGMAIAGIETEIHAVRVSDVKITNELAMQRLLRKTVDMMHHLDNSVPNNTASLARIRIRDRFFGSGYAQTTPAGEDAISFARNELGLVLESTYTGKTMAALLADCQMPATDKMNILYWHTFNSVPLAMPTDQPVDDALLPEEFLRYFAAQER